MTQDPQGFDKEPEVPDAEAANHEVPTEPGAPDAAAAGAPGSGPEGAAPARDGSGVPSAPSSPSPGAGAPGAGERGAAESREAALTAQLDQVRTALHERTQDVQRLQAEFQNYRRRVERDRIAVKEMAVGNLLTELLPVLDDIGRARDHGELVGGFKQVAESLETVAAKMGLMQFGKEGEPFDPTVHEALMHSYSPDVTETTCVQILQPGYRIGDRTIRPARVGVAEPQPGAQQSKASGPAAAAEGGGSGEGARDGEAGAGNDDGGPDED